MSETNAKNALLSLLAASLIGCGGGDSPQGRPPLDGGDGKDTSFDTTSPDGYCTISGCSTDSCPDEAACVSFQDDNFRFCMLACTSNEECRTDVGYECVLSSALPAGVALLDSTAPTGYCGVAP